MHTIEYACPLRMRIQLHTPARCARPHNYTGVPNAHAHTIVLAHCVCIGHTTAKTCRTTHAHTSAFDAQNAACPIAFAYGILAAYLFCWERVHGQCYLYLCLRRKKRLKNKIYPMCVCLSHAYLHLPSVCLLFEKLWYNEGH